MRRVTSWIVAFLFACLFVMFIQMFLVKSAVVQTDDMSPTLNKGDRVIINKIKVTFNMLKMEILSCIDIKSITLW